MIEYKRKLTCMHYEEDIYLVESSEKIELQAKRKIEFTGQTKSELSMGITTDYYTFKYLPCCFPAAKEACFCFLRRSSVVYLSELKVTLF